MIELKTLGRTGISKNGEQLSGIASHKQKFALLVYLALEGQVGRDRLIAIFWPDREEDRARHSLSQALYALKRELGEEHLSVDGDSVVVCGPACDFDARRLERAASAEDWSTVVDLYNGPFLDQFFLPGAPAFEKWQTAARVRLARLARRAFPNVVGEQEAAGETSSALATAWRWALLDPLEDEANHALILLLARSGDRVGALEHYDAYRARLARELEVEPLEDTVALVERIRAGDVPEFRPLAAAGRVDSVEPTGVRESPVAYRVATDAEPTPPREPAAPLSLLEELKKRRVFHVGAAYLAVAWLAIQLAGTLVDRAVVPDWLFPVTLGVLAAGLPLALILTWAQKMTPAAMPDTTAYPTRRPWPRWAERVRGGQVLGFLSVLIVGLLAGLLILEREFIDVAGLREDRVVVFPLLVSPDGNEVTGEKVAMWIGYTLESTGRFKWIDGWWGLDDLQRAGIDAVSPNAAAEQARAERAAYYVRGRISLQDDSVQALVELRSAADNAILAHGNAAGTLDAAWISRESESIARQLLTALLPEQQPIELASGSDTPQAVSEFLDGETAYRRARFEEALEHYNRAVALDSTFALAALKGALAASWRYETEQARRLVAVATRRRAFLEPGIAQFARGLEDYYEGRPDGAIAHLQAALAIEPEWPEAWAQLGETYTHFLPDAAPLDSLAEAAFIQARRHQLEFHPVLYHLIEILVRKGNTQQARALVAEFREEGPDSSHLASTELKLECVERSPRAIDWRDELRRDPMAVYSVAQSLAKAGAHTDCARAGWGALLDERSAQGAEPYRFASLMSLQSLLVAEGRYDDLENLLASQTGFQDYAEDFFLLDANAGADVEPQARARADELWGDLDSGSIESYHLWMLAIWEHERGRPERVRLLADTLAARAARSDDRLDGMLADILQARAVLAAGDSTAAVELLRDLAPTKRRTDYWYPWETLAAETVLLAELLYARGEYAEAIRVAASLDAPARPAVDLMYLPASLVVRARSARELGDAQQVERSRDRLARLGRIDLLAELEN